MSARARRGVLVLFVPLGLALGAAAMSSGWGLVPWVRPDPADEPRRLAESFLQQIASDELPRACGTVLPDGGLVNPCLDARGARPEELRQIRELGTDITVTGVHLQGDHARVTSTSIEPHPRSSLSVDLERSGDSWRVARLNEVDIEH